MGGAGSPILHRQGVRADLLDRVVVVAVAVDIGDTAITHQPRAVRRDHQYPVLTAAETFDLDNDAPLPSPDQRVELAGTPSAGNIDVEKRYPGLSRAPFDPLGEPLLS